MYNFFISYRGRSTGAMDGTHYRMDDPGIIGTNDQEFLQLLLSRQDRIKNGSG